MTEAKSGRKVASAFKCCTDKIKTNDDPDPASGNERTAMGLYKSDFRPWGRSNTSAWRKAGAGEGPDTGGKKLDLQV